MRKQQIPPPCEGRAVQVPTGSKAEMQAGRGRAGFDVKQGVVFNNDGHGNGYSPPSRRRGGRDVKKMLRSIL